MTLPKSALWRRLEWIERNVPKLIFRKKSLRNDFAMKNKWVCNICKANISKENNNATLYINKRLLFV